MLLTFGLQASVMAFRNLDGPVSLHRGWVGAIIPRKPYGSRELHRLLPQA